MHEIGARHDFMHAKNTDFRPGSRSGISCTRHLAVNRTILLLYVDNKNAKFGARHDLMHEFGARHDSMHRAKYTLGNQGSCSRIE